MLSIIHKKAIQYIKDNWETDIILSTQSYLEGFYKPHGFQTISKEYSIEEVPHLDMKLSK